MRFFNSLLIYCILTVIPIFGTQSLSSLRQELGQKNHTDSKEKHIELLNVSYDSTREFYEEYNKMFSSWWKNTTGQEISIVQSHGASSKQARAVITGLEADVVSLALAFDIDIIEQTTKLIGKNWQTRLPNNNCPYFSTIVFVVRKGNNKKIKDWNDLIDNMISLVIPNPKTSGGAKWIYLAAYGWFLKQSSGNSVDAKEKIKKFYANTSVLDAGSRSATTTFVQKKIGDVLVTWENEALLIQQKIGIDKYDIIYPSKSIKAEPPITWVEGNIKNKNVEDAAKYYVRYLYSTPAQQLAATNYFRPFDDAVIGKNVKKFPKIDMFTINDFGGWEKAYKEHFSDGGLFDQIYTPTNNDLK